MRRKDSIDENETRGKASKRAGPVGAIARWRDNTRARLRNRDGGVPVGSIMAAAVAILLVSSIVAAPIAGQSSTFDGEVSLSGSSATSSTSWSYEINDLDGASDLSVELTGERVTESTSTSSHLATGESYTVSPAGNAAPENETVEIEGVRETEDRSVSVADGDSVDVGGNVAPENVTIKLSGDYSETERSTTISGESSGSSQTINTGGSLDPTNAEITITNIETQSETLSGTMPESFDNWQTFGSVSFNKIGSVTYNVDATFGPSYDFVDYKVMADGASSGSTYFGGDDLHSEGTTTYTANGGGYEIGDNNLKMRHGAGNDGSVSHTNGQITVTRYPDTPVSVDTGAGSAVDLSEGQTASVNLSAGSDTISVSHDYISVDYKVTWTERSGVEDPSVSVGSSTVSHSGVLNGTIEESVDLSTGSQSVSESYTGSGSYLDTTVNFSEVTQTEDPAVDVGGTTVYHSGVMSEGEVYSESVTLSETSSTEINRTGGSADAIVRTSWDEIAETQDPQVTVNGETASYSGHLPDGQTTSLSVSDNWIQEGENTVNVDMAGSNGGPEPQVGVSYSHTASTVALNETVESTTWSENVSLSRTFASDQTGVVLEVGMPDNVVGIDGIETRRDGGEWSSVSSSNYTLDGTDLTVDMGDVASNETVEVRADGDKTKVTSGAIKVVDPTLEGNELATRMRVTDAAGTDPVKIEVSETVQSDRIHMVGSAEWESSEYHVSEADGTETLVLPDAVADSEATIETAPIGASPETGDVRVEIVNQSANRFTIAPGSSSGDSVEIAYYDTESGQYYELYSETEERQIEVDQAESPVFFITDDRDGTYTIGITDAPGTSVIVGGDGDGGGGLPAALLLLAGILGVGAVGIITERTSLDRRLTLVAGGIAVLGIAELSTSASVLGTLSNDLIRGSSSELIATIATAGGLGGAWLLERRSSIDVPTWLYGAIGVGGTAWIATAALGETGSSIAGIVVGGAVLVGLWGASRRWDLPRWLVGVVGVATVVFMLEAVLPGLLEELVVGPIASGAREIAPLVVLGVLVVVVIWLRRRGDDSNVTLEVMDNGD